MKTAILTATPLAAILLAAPAQAIDWTGSGDGSSWSDANNWGGNVPDDNTETARFLGNADVDINVDQNFTVQSYTDGFAGTGFTTTIGGPGTLTFDRNLDSVVTIANSTGNDGSILRFTGNVAINNTAGGTTYAQNGNSAGNTILFDAGSTLTLTTGLNATGSGSHQFNGTVAGSGTLGIAANNVSFGAGHDSSTWTGDVSMNGTGRFLAINGGTVGNSGVDLRGNFGTNEIELNGANVINGANVTTGVSATTPNLTLDINANQVNMGTITLGAGSSLTLDLLGSGVTSLFFADSSSRNWNDATVSILGFQEGVIKFGSDASGLLPAQLAAIDDGLGNFGIYSLTSSGYLTAVPEPTTLGLLLFGAMGLAVRRKRA